MALRGIRGAITVSNDRRDEVLAETRRLLLAIQEANPNLIPSDIGSAFFSVTADIASAFPAEAAREIGWGQAPLLCFREIPVLGSLPLCIRVLIHWNTDLSQGDIHHVYLGKAKVLRPDLEMQRG
jgi:chorismate mutase